jgi:hypothetical protein
MSNRLSIQKYIEDWKLGRTDGNKGKEFPQLSNRLKRFLLEKFGEKYCLCGWNKKHPLTKKAPLEVNHADFRLRKPPRL